MFSALIIARGNEMRRDLIFHDSGVDNIDNWNNYGQLTVWHLTNPGNWASIWSARCVFSDRKKMCFMQTESVLQTKNRSGPAKNLFSVALVCNISTKCWKDPMKALRRVDSQNMHYQPLFTRCSCPSMAKLKTLSVCQNIIFQHQTSSCISSLCL